MIRNLLFAVQLYILLHLHREIWSCTLWLWSHLPFTGFLYLVFLSRGGCLHMHNRTCPDYIPISHFNLFSPSLPFHFFLALSFPVVLPTPDARRTPDGRTPFPPMACMYVRTCVPTSTWESAWHGIKSTIHRRWGREVMREMGDGEMGQCHAKRLFTSQVSAAGPQPGNNILSPRPCILQLRA